MTLQIPRPVPPDSRLPWPLRWLAHQPRRPLVGRFDLAHQPRRPLWSRLFGQRRARIAPKWTRSALSASNLLASLQQRLVEHWSAKPMIRRPLPHLGLGNRAILARPYRVMLMGLAQQPSKPLSKRLHTPILLRRPYIVGTFLVAGSALYFAAVFPNPWLQDSGGTVIAAEAAKPVAVEPQQGQEAEAPPTLAQAEAPSEPTPPWDEDAEPIAEPAPEPQPAQAEEAQAPASQPEAQQTQPPPPEPLAPAAETAVQSPPASNTQTAAPAQPDPDLAARTRTAAVLADARRLYTSGDGVAAVAKLEQALASGAIHSDYRDGARGLKRDMQALLELFRQGDAAFKAGNRDQAMGIWRRYLSAEQAVFLRPTAYSQSIKARMTEG